MSYFFTSARPAVFRFASLDLLVALLFTAFFFSAPPRLRVSAVNPFPRRQPEQPSRRPRQAGLQ